MQYRANRIVLVDAFRIVLVRAIMPDDSMLVSTEDGLNRRIPKDMISKIPGFIPSEGDYWVIQSDGHEYVSPKDVFERKHSPTFVYVT